MGMLPANWLPQEIKEAPCDKYSERVFFGKVNTQTQLPAWSRGLQINTGETQEGRASASLSLSLQDTPGLHRK